MAADKNGTVPADQQPDETIGTSVDEKINVVDTRTETPLPRVNINEPVTPGHDMVVNHIDGSQELAQGSVAAAIHTQEAKTGEVVSKADVEAGDAQEAPRSPDPETNGPDQQVPGKTADQQVAASQPEVSPNQPVPAFPTPAEGGEESSASDAASDDAAQASDAPKE